MREFVARPRVSVIMPVFNGSATIGEALESLEAQTYRDFEVVVVDDGSTDDTAEICRGRPGLRLIDQGNRGTAAARNVGIRAARGELIAFLDQDDLWSPGRLAAQVPILEDEADVGLVFSNFEAFGDLSEHKGKRFDDAKVAERISEGRAFASLFRKNLIHPATVLVRRACLDEVGLFDESIYFEDYDLWLRIARRFPIRYVPAPLASVRHHTGNKRSDAVALQRSALFIIERAARECPELTEQLGRRAVKKKVAKMHYYYGRALVEAGRRRQARTSFGRAIRLYPAKARFWHALASTFVRKVNNVECPSEV